MTADGIFAFLNLHRPKNSPWSTDHTVRVSTPPRSATIHPETPRFARRSCRASRICGNRNSKCSSCSRLDTTRRPYSASSGSVRSIHLAPS